MGTQLIFTVGTNPLPVWVAWYHLKDKLPQPIHVRFVHTAGTIDERDRLQKYCQGASFLDPIQTSAGNPEQVRRDISSILRSLQPGAILQVHYTGGTKVMAVEIVAAIEANISHSDNIYLETSYLDPRAQSGPTIVNRAGNTWVKDTRKGIEVDLKHIAELNGFEIGPFDHRYRGNTLHCPAPIIPTNEQLLASQAILEAVIDRQKNKKFQTLLGRQDSKWNEIFSPKSHFALPNHEGSFLFPSWVQENFLSDLSKAYPDCQWNIANGKLSYPSHTVASNAEKNALEQIHDFFNGKWLEYAVYAAFKEALEGIQRDNYQLFHSVYVRRKARGDSAKPFELDVVVGLGYQIVVVSCSVTATPQQIKLKAMEAILRARQLGGDEARAIVLCSAFSPDDKSIEEELEDEMGSQGLPLRVWGKNRWKNLPQEFAFYLRNALNWR